jgi:8-oxo-dGTP pyrophosphatase MutT (NUDIX family)
MNKSRTTIYKLVGSIRPFDQRESHDLAEALSWIGSDAPLFRVQKPDVPPRHLVSYFVPVDMESGTLLLLDHMKAGLWLPPGGHVEPDEHPRETVWREMLEELFAPADFSTPAGQLPLFLTATTTRGQGEHVDVSLWYAVSLSSRSELAYDAREFSGYRWLTFDEVLALPIETLDPQMHRFTRKLQAVLAN